MFIYFEKFAVQSLGSKNWCLSPLTVIINETILIK